MGFAYHNGIGVNKDISSARLCYVSLLYESGGCEFDQKIIQKAARWYERSGKEEDDNAVFIIGELYHDGKGVSKKNEKATKPFEKASHGSGQ